MRSLGTVVPTATDCSINGWIGIPGKECTKLTISVPGLADQSAIIGVNQPAGDPLGVVVFLTGGGDPVPYDSAFTYGLDVVSEVLAAGYTTVQLFFPYAPVGASKNAGWITTNQGILAAAARPATALAWIQGNLNPLGLPFVGVGNSGGSSLLVYAMGDYGIFFSAVVLGSGPTYAKLAEGCGLIPPSQIATPCGEGTQSTLYVRNTQVMDVDPAYGASSACSLHAAGALTRFQNDSILRSDTTLAFPQTDIVMLLGGLDLSAAVGQATMWFNSLTPGGSRSQNVVCIPTATHGLPDTVDGANQVISSILAIAQPCQRGIAAGTL